MVYRDQWDSYAHMQRTAMTSSSCSSAAVGHETAMTELLTTMSSGELVTEEGMERLVATCQRRERNQRAIIARHNFPYWQAPRDESAAHEARIMTGKVETVLNANDRSILVRVAAGYTAAEIGQITGLAEPSVRQRVRRARKKVAHLRN